MCNVEPSLCYAHLRCIHKIEFLIVMQEGPQESNSDWIRKERAAHKQVLSFLGLMV